MYWVGLFVTIFIKPFAIFCNFITTVIHRRELSFQLHFIYSLRNCSSVCCCNILEVLGTTHVKSGLISYSEKIIQQFVYPHLVLQNKLDIQKTA